MTNVGRLGYSAATVVFFQSNFKMDSHIEFILSQCAQRMYLLKHLRHRGLPDAQLSVVAYVIAGTRAWLRDSAERNR